MFTSVVFQALYTITILRLSVPVTAQSSNSTLVVSQDGSCAGTTGQTCLGSTFGNCCSQKGYCGSTADYCSKNCQSAFGSCPSGDVQTVSTDGFCGADDPNHQMCIGSQWGPCCSGKGYCGKTAVYCSTGCQSDYGSCGGGNLTNPVPSSSAPSTMSTTTTSTSTSSTGSAAAQQTSSTAPVAQPVIESTGFKAGMGVLGGLLGLALIGLIAFLLRRKQQKKHRQPPMYDETKHFTDGSFETPTAPTTAHGDHPYDKAIPLPPSRKPYEMESASQSRHELDHKAVPAIEMSTERY